MVIRMEPFEPRYLPDNKAIKELIRGLNTTNKYIL
jgi:hypothetical protein